MPNASNKDRVIKAWQEFATRDPIRVAAVFTPDAEWFAPPENATALALDGTSHLVGRARIVRFFTEDFGSVFADVQIDFTGLYGEGDHVIVEERMQATLTHGGHYDVDYCFVFQLREGLIHRVREYMDTRKGTEMFRVQRADAMDN